MTEAKGVHVASYLPTRVITNEEIESWGVNKETDSSKSPNLLTAAGILKVTGMERRFVAGPSENAISMGVRAVDRLPIEARNIDAIFASSTFPMHEGIAQSIADELGATLSVADTLNHHKACSGVGSIFSYIANGHEDKFWGKNVVIVASEKYSPHLVDLRDEDGVARDPSMSQNIFSDAAVAMVGVYGRDFRVLTSSFQDFPEQRDLITLPVDESQLIGPFEYYPVPYSDKVIQHGSDVFRLVLRNVPKQILAAIDEAHVTYDEVDYIVPHQGSIHVVRDAIADHLPQSLKDKVVHAYQDGNMSSASALWALEQLSEKGRVIGKLIDFPTFGAGPLSYNNLVRFN